MTLTSEVSDKVFLTTPKQAAELLTNDPTAQLIDVRNTFELVQSGYPDLSFCGKNIILLPWYSEELPRQGNRDFSIKLKCSIPQYSSPVIFLCAHGIRSCAAAILAAYEGYEKCYSIEHGYEGNKDTGWKQENLPWRI